MCGIFGAGLDLVHGCTYVAKPREGRERRIIKTILTTEGTGVHREKRLFFTNYLLCTSVPSRQ